MGGYEMPLHRQHKLAHILAQIRLGYQRKWLSIDTVNVTSAPWLKQLLSILQRHGVLAHIEPVLYQNMGKAVSFASKRPAKLRLYLRYINGRPAVQF